MSRRNSSGSVVRQADALIRILSAVLEISRSEALTGRNQFAWFDVGELAAELTEMYDPLVEERGAVLEFDAPSANRAPVRPSPTLGAGGQQSGRKCDPLWRGRRQHPRCGVTPGEREIQVEVSDNGPGIPAERREEARRRFGRLDSSRSEEGAGLGLALAESIAHLHQGKLLLDDNAPGLRTVLRLPVVPGDTG